MTSVKQLIVSCGLRVNDKFLLESRFIFMLDVEVYVSNKVLRAYLLNLTLDGIYR